MTTNQELLPCPFCGGKAKYESRLTGACGSIKHTEYVRCLTRSCRMLVEGSTCIKRWNTRHPAPKENEK